MNEQEVKQESRRATLFECAKYRGKVYLEDFVKDFKRFITGNATFAECFTLLVRGAWFTLSTLAMASQLIERRFILSIVIALFAWQVDFSVRRCAFYLMRRKAVLDRKARHRLFSKHIERMK